MITARNLVKTFALDGQCVQALDLASVSVSPGEFVSIVGPSGSGKSTLLLIIGGLLEPTTGDVTVDGAPVYELAPRERAALRRNRIGFMFQTFNLLPYLTATENVQVPMYLAGHGRDYQQERAAQLLTDFGLAKRLHHRPGQLSVGERQRVALARALANDPGYILADEPTGNLDGEKTWEIIEILRDLRSGGKTIVMVTHDTSIAAATDRVLELNEGRVFAQVMNQAHS